MAAPLPCRLSSRRDSFRRSRSCSSRRSRSSDRAPAPPRHRPQPAFQGQRQKCFLKRKSTNVLRSRSEKFQCNSKVQNPSKPYEQPRNRVFQITLPYCKLIRANRRITAFSALCIVPPQRKHSRGCANSRLVSFEIHFIVLYVHCLCRSLVFHDADFACIPLVLAISANVLNRYHIFILP